MIYSLNICRFGFWQSKIFVASLLTVPLIACAQTAQKMSDAQFDGLKGKIKTVRYENSLVDEAGKETRKRTEMSSLTTYDIEGTKTERIGYVSGIPTFRTRYWVQKDASFSKNEKLKEPQPREGDAPPPARQATNEKTLPKDNSFDSRIENKYDGVGNLIQRSVFSNDGLLLNKRTYEYDSRRNKIKESVFTSEGLKYNNSSIYIFDSKGNVTIETNFLGNGSGEESQARPNHKLTYEYLKFDEHGNWLERRVFDSINNKPTEGIPKLVMIEYQTISFH